MTWLVKALAFLICVTVSAAVVNSQNDNLLQNPNADDGGNGWRMFFHDASVEHGANGNPHFVLRNSGQVSQLVRLPDGSAGKYALLAARVSSDMINNDGTWTGCPVMVATTFSKIASDGDIATSFPGDYQWLPPLTTRPFEWVTLTGNFRISESTVAIQFRIARWDDQNSKSKNGPAARFDDLGLYVFKTEKDADIFVKAYNERDRPNRIR